MLVEVWDVTAVNMGVRVLTIDVCSAVVIEMPVDIVIDVLTTIIVGVGIPVLIDMWIVMAGSTAIALGVSVS